MVPTLLKGCDGVQHIPALFEQRYAALLDAVAGAGFQLKIIQVLLLQTLGNGVRQAAAAGKDASEIAGVVQHVLRKAGDSWL